jgi:tripartite-type tricarboxylate transporter receptor subunit TctC
MRRLLSAIVVLSCVFGPARFASAADNWPDKPIHFVVPFPAGSVTDLVSRIVADGLSAKLRQTIVVDNRPGASGEVGDAFIARAAPDGYTIGLATASTLAVAPSLNPNLAYDSLNDFALISLVGQAPYVLVVNSGVPATNVTDLIGLAKAKPGALNYSTVGPASLAQFAGSLFSSMAKVKLTAIPYRSATIAALDLVEGRIQMQFGATAATLPFINQGKLRALAVTSLERLDILPNVPTMSEAGLPGYEAALWMAIVAPRGTPQSIVDRLNQEIRLVLAEPTIKKRMAGEVLQVETSSPAELKTHITKDIAKWRALAKEMNIKPE